MAVVVGGGERSTFLVSLTEDFPLFYASPKNKIAKLVGWASLSHSAIVLPGSNLYLFSNACAGKLEVSTKILDFAISEVLKIYERPPNRDYFRSYKQS